MEHNIDYGNLEFREKLGEGGFGSVNRVTFKQPFRGFTEAAAKSVVDFRKEEVEILAKLSHPHVVKLIGFYQNGPVNIIVLEYAKHGSLHDFLSDNSRPLTDDLKRKWIRESALGLQHLHGNKCLHRDIKASNCLIFEDDVLKLSDFGIAREIRHSVTMSSQKGTLQYMAPELIVTDDNNLAYYSRFSDIYAYGMLVLEICTLKAPFEGKEYAYVMYQVGQENMQPTIPSSCPRDLADLMKQCCSRHSRKRPAIDTVLEVLDSKSASSSNLTQTANTYGSSRIAIWPVAEPLKAKRIACSSNGDLVFGALSNVHIFEGKDRQTPRQIFSSANAQVWSIAVAPSEQILMLDGHMKVKVLNKKRKFFGKAYRDLSTLMVDEDQHAQVEPTCLAVDKEGRILVGDSWKDVLSVHSFPDGKVMCKIKCHIHSAHSTIAVNSRRQILQHFRSSSAVYSEVAAIDYHGQEIFHFTPRIDKDLGGGKKVRPRGIVCDNQDNIYIIIKVVKGFDSVEYTGHLHKYSPTGRFIECLIKGLYKPCDLAITPDGSSLVIANHKSILAYAL